MTAGWRITSLGFGQNIPEVENHRPLRETITAFMTCSTQMIVMWN